MSMPADRLEGERLPALWDQAEQRARVALNDKAQATQSP